MRSPYPLDSPADGSSPCAVLPWSHQPRVIVNKLSHYSRSRSGQLLPWHEPGGSCDSAGVHPVLFIAADEVDWHDIGAVRLLGLVVGGLLLIAAIRAMFR